MIEEIAWKAVVELSKALKCRVRISVPVFDAVTDWDSIFEPVPGYVELPKFGPVRKVDVEYVEIDPIIKVRVGRLVPDKVYSVEDDVLRRLNEESISYSKEGSYIRIP